VGGVENGRFDFLIYSLLPEANALLPRRTANGHDTGVARLRARALQCCKCRRRTHQARGQCRDSRLTSSPRARRDRGLV